MTVPPNIPSREVASGVANLGNTCYMNAVLQALAHAPELCMAVDVEPHRVKCPVALKNAEKRRNSPSPPVESQRKRSIRKSRRSGKKSPSSDGEDRLELQFCALCEFENHLSQVHTRASTSGAVAPETFVNGFIDQVAPWFRLGVQEDSHEFLRLLIDAMQKSCSLARATTDSGEDSEYPFKLFRGTVESNVRCGSCGACSAKIDPIEDIGLEVTSTSSASALTDITSALQRFTRAEPLDSGYKCDKCGNMGKATKQSKLASIPPILTLHLKRFRYGSDGKPIPPLARRGREVAQLLGASGSAKIEGHIKFMEFFDLRPFMTSALSSQHKNMYCRLFAIIVHAGKNSHSGHYVAYVRNMTKNEWWKMDDARVTRVATSEVFRAEAYMLLYRVVEHPVAQELRAKAMDLTSRRSEEVSTEEKSRSTETVIPPPKSDSETVTPSESPPTKIDPDTVDDSHHRRSSHNRKRKRLDPEFSSGEDWARAKTNIPPSLMSVLRKAEEYISKNVEFKPEFLKRIAEDAARGLQFGGGSVMPSEDDIKGGSERFRQGLVELMYRLSARCPVSNGSSDFLKETETIEAQVGEDEDEGRTLIVPVVEANETYL